MLTNKKYDFVITVIALVAFMCVSYVAGESIGEIRGERKGRAFCEKHLTNEKNNNTIQILKEQAVFDFQYCTGDNYSKAITIKDVKITRTLPTINCYEITVCEQGRYWYSCNTAGCTREKRTEK